MRRIIQSFLLKYLPTVFLKINSLIKNHELKTNIYSKLIKSRDAEYLLKKYNIYLNLSRYIRLIS